MSNISNRFFVTALDDGSTLHGNLSADKALSQAYNGTSGTPDWSVAANQPTIFLTLLSGATLVDPTNIQNVKWFYNGTEIVFNGSNISTSPAPAGAFQKTTHSVTYGTATYNMPALKIINNLVSADNVDMDTITFKAEYVSDGAAIAFESTAQIRITTMSKGGYLGLINFVNGIADITYQGQTITLWAELFGGEDGGHVPGFTVTWYINETEVQSTDTRLTTYNTYPAIVISEGDITDHATIRAEFKVGGVSKYTAYAAIDDMQDPQYMYIQNDGANGNAASLRSGDTATFTIWVGTRTDNGVYGGTTNPTYGWIYVKLLNGDGDVVTTAGLATSIPDVANANLQPSDAGYGYRRLTVSGGKGVLTPHYNTVSSLGKNMTGIVMAYTSKPSWDTSA